MPRFSRGASIRTTRTSRKTEWNNGPAGTAGIISATGQYGFTAGEVDVLAAGITIVRTRGEFLIGLLSADDVGTAAGFRCAFGIGVISKQAADAGGAAVPDPQEDSDWAGWLYHVEFSLLTPVVAAVGNVGMGPGQLRLNIDSKGMRKIGENDTIFAQLGVAERGVSTLYASLETRMLVKLP